MIKSISAWAFDPNRPLPEVFKLARDHGFEAVEVAFGMDGPLNPATTQDDCREIVAQAQDAGIVLSSVASGLGWSNPITSTDPVVAQRGVELTAQTLRAAAWLGLDAILLVPGGVGATFNPQLKDAPYDQAYANAQKCLRELIPVAQETGVSIGVENVWNMFLLSPLETRNFIDELGSDKVGSYFDVGNVIYSGYAEQWISILGERIKRVHFKDFKRDVGNISGFCDLLDGDVDYPAVMKALREIGYDGPVTAEFFTCEADLGKISSAMDKILEM